MADKHTDRLHFLHTRNNLHPSEVLSRSKLIAKNLFSLNIFRQSLNIALYCPVQNEVDTKFIHNQARKLRKKVYYPRVTGNLISFYRIKDTTELIPGSFGIPEPANSIKYTPLNLIDVFIIPGICFDTQGNRIGFGKGYYDRSLKFIDKNKKIGLAYSFQIVDRINTDIYDMSLSYIITEKGIINAREGGH